MPPTLRSPLLPRTHAFLTREGGVSEGPYASLNCSLSGGDDPARVRENRARAARAAGAEPAALLGLTQVHGADVVAVTDGWAPGQGPRADAMVTDRRGPALGIVTADCAPVLFADAAAGVVGAAHAGWRSALSGVLENTIAAMRALGAGRIAAAVGPCIAQPSYEVGSDLRDAVLSRTPDDATFFGPGRPGHWWFDLSGYCAARLRAAGADVEVLAADTCAEAGRFFSHRRRTLAGGGPIGHQIAIITIPHEEPRP